MRRDITLASFVLGISLLALGCSKDESAPPPVATCAMLPDNVACERANGECVSLRCIDQNWECGPDESLVVLTPGRCSSVDAGDTDAGPGH